MKKKAIVVGSGAGGATVAKELQGQYEVTVLEAGKAFKPFGMELEGLEKLRQFGLFFDDSENVLSFSVTAAGTLSNAMPISLMLAKWPAPNGPGMSKGRSCRAISSRLFCAGSLK